ncbi:hypothetical protein GCM10009859_17200 [Kocuria salsicia]
MISHARPGTRRTGRFRPRGMDPRGPGWARLAEALAADEEDCPVRNNRATFPVCRPFGAACPQKRENRLA